MQQLIKLLIFWAAATVNAATVAQTITLTVASFPDFDRAVKTAIPLYKKLHPEVNVQLSSLSFGDHHSAMSVALATGANLPDVIAVEYGFVGKFAASDGLENLSKAPYNGLAYSAKLSLFSIAQGKNSAGALIAMPADIGPGALFYRKDLLDKAGVGETDLTASWESFIEAGKKIKAATGAYLLASATDIKDIYIRSGLKEGEGIYFDSKGEPLITSPRFQKAFQFAKAARAAGIDAKIEAWSNEWSESIKHDKIVSQMMGAWLAGHLKNWLAPESAGKWRSAQLPGGAFGSWGGSFYAIPKKSQHKAATWEFIKFMCLNKEMQLAAFRQLDAFPALIEAQSDALINQPITYLGGQKARQLWKIAADRIHTTAVNKFDPLANDIVNAEFEKVMVQNKDIVIALADAQALLKKRIRR